MLYGIQQILCMGEPLATNWDYNNGAATMTDSPYVSGVSLIHRAPGARQHI